MSLTHCARLLVPHSEHLTRLVVWDMSSHEARKVLIDFGLTVPFLEVSLVQSASRGKEVTSASASDIVAMELAGYDSILAPG